MAAAVIIPVFAACSDSEPANPDVPQTSAPEESAAHGPFFPECGGIGDQEVISQTRVPGLVNTATTVSNHRYGRAYFRSSAHNMPLLSHTRCAGCSTAPPENCINMQVNRHVGG